MVGAQIVDSIRLTTVQDGVESIAAVRNVQPSLYILTGSVDCYFVSILKKSDRLGDELCQWGYIELVPHWERNTVIS